MPYGCKLKCQIT
uniref:Uncharacterized protein n=1 Tax=Anguilla anguilla TaxID=7936 RepID=A0A0E9QEB8_ANGAN